MKREFALALAAVCCLSVPAAAQYMPGTQEQVSHWAARTYWPGDRHHWPGYGYGGRGYGVRAPTQYSAAPARPEVWWMGDVGYRAIYKPRHYSKGRPTERISRSPARTRQ